MAPEKVAKTVAKLAKVHISRWDRRYLARPNPMELLHLDQDFGWRVDGLPYTKGSSMAVSSFHEENWRTWAGIPHPTKTSVEKGQKQGTITLNFETVSYFLKTYPKIHLIAETETTMMLFVELSSKSTTENAETMLYCAVRLETKMENTYPKTFSSKRTPNPSAKAWSLTKLRRTTLQSRSWRNMRCH